MALLPSPISSAVQDPVVVRICGKRGGIEGKRGYLMNEAAEMKMMNIKGRDGDERMIKMRCR